jgi:hypothetical protein
MLVQLRRPIDRWSMTQRLCSSYARNIWSIAGTDLPNSRSTCICILLCLGNSVLLGCWNWPTKQWETCFLLCLGKVCYSRMLAVVQSTSISGDTRQLPFTFSLWCWHWHEQRVKVRTLVSIQLLVACAVRHTVMTITRGIVSSMQCAVGIDKIRKWKDVPWYLYSYHWVVESYPGENHSVKSWNFMKFGFDRVTVRHTIMILRHCEQQNAVRYWHWYAQRLKQRTLVPVHIVY